MPARRAPQCSCCKHRENTSIDLGLSRGVSVLALSRRYGVTTDSLYRHRKLHLSPQLRAKLLQGPDTEIDLDKLRETESQSLLANLVALRRRLFASFDYAEEMGDTHLLTRVSSQIHTNLEITGKLIGDLGVAGSTTNILVLPTYVEMRVELVRALAPFPEARVAVAQVLHAIESKAADAIVADKRELAS
jgi:transposase-like protein